MFKSIAASWNNASLANKCFITYMGMCTVIIVAKAVATSKK